MNGLQWWILAGVLVMGGLASLVWWLVPAQPDLGAVLDRLTPTAGPRRTSSPFSPDGLDGTRRVGLWASQHLPAGWMRVPEQDLAILGKARHELVGEKVLMAGIGLVAGPLLSALFVVAFGLPAGVPVAASLGAAAGLWFVPDGEVKKRAKAARAEFTQAVAVYTDLLALERRAGGSGTRQAMENAARVAASWPFRRIGHALARSSLSEQQPWDALHDLSRELDVAALDDVADIMRMSGEQGARVYESLRARSSAMRSAMLSAEHTKADELARRMALPSTATGLIFAAIAAAPGIMRLLAG